MEPVLATLGRLLLEAIAPRRCAGCDAVSEEPLCVRCVRAIDDLPVPTARAMAYGSAHAGFEFVEPVRSAVHRGKYGGDRRALEALGRLVSGRLELDGPAIPDAVAPVPLGPRRRRQRGYNQAEVLAGVIAGARGVPLLEGLRRVRDTAPQSSRDEVARRRNVTGAFGWEGPSLRGARLWLVDDVLTTGATLESAAAAMAGAGAARIDAIVVAVVL